MLVCAWCSQSKVFSDKRRRRYCSDECREAARQDRYGFTSLSGESGLSTITVGVLSEMRVAADLIRRGYQVFRPISPSKDLSLLVMREARVWRVRVRTAHQRANSKVYVDESGNHDVLAAVLPDSIEYRPEFEA